MVNQPDKRIKEFVARVTRKYKLDKAIFWGSRARGDYLLHSDYDIILVSKDFKNIFFTKRISLMYQFWPHYYVLEPLCYTPEEFEKKKRQIGIIREAIREGMDLA